MGLPKTIEKILNNDKNIVAEQILQISDLNHPSIYSISDKIIADVGRFCERYQSDFLITWNSLMERIKTNESGICLFGIREDGVDGTSYVFLRMRDHKNDYSFRAHYYRRIYAVEFKKIENEYHEILMRIRLKNIGHELSYDDADDDYDINDLP